MLPWYRFHAKAPVPACLGEAEDVVRPEAAEVRPEPGDVAQHQHVVVQERDARVVLDLSGAQARSAEEGQDKTEEATCRDSTSGSEGHSGAAMC